MPINVFHHYDRVVHLRTQCALDPSLAMDDPEEIERVADQLMRTDPEKAILALQHAIRISKDARPTLWLRLGDFRVFSQDCAAATQAYEMYIRLAQVTGAELANVRDREAQCLTQNQ